MFNVRPVVYVSKGLCKIDEVTMSDRPLRNGDLLVRQTLSELLISGFTVQSTTETVDGGASTQHLLPEEEGDLSIEGAGNAYRDLAHRPI